MSNLSGVFNSIQKCLFPELEEEIGELSERMKEFVRVVEVANLPEHMAEFNWQGMGCPPCSRMSIFKAFIMKAVYNYPTTKAMIENVKLSPPLRRLCGWETVCEIPHESTFCRAFAQFAKTELPQKIHAEIVKTQIGKERITGHVSRDSTAIEAREKAIVKEEKPINTTTCAHKKRGRPKKGEIREEIPLDPKRMDLQKARSLEENLFDVPKACDWGAKRDSKGKNMTWKGYKLHIDTIDGDIPVSAVLSSASLHDSQLAIPLMQMTTERLTYLYDIMDSAYDASPIHEFSRSQNHVPIIDHNPRRGKKREFEPAKKIRYNERTAAERVNSDLKDNHGGKTVRVKGSDKVFAHLMFGIITITVSQLFNMLC